MSPEAGYFLLHDIAPRLYAAVPHRVKRCGAEDADELCQDAIAMAAQMVDRLEQSSKQVTAGSVAHYVLKNLQAGRRSTGTSVVDIMAPGTQLQKRAGLSSLNEPLGSDVDDISDGEFLDLRASDREDPATAALRELDWKEFLLSCNMRERNVLATLAEGGELQSVAARCGASCSAISSDKRRIAGKIKEQWGGDILEQIDQAPSWQNSLTAGREKRAARMLSRNR